MSEHSITGGSSMSSRHDVMASPTHAMVEPLPLNSLSGADTASAGAPSAGDQWVESIQLALAIADPTLLQHLVLHSSPPVVAPHRLGALHLKAGVPLSTGAIADGVLEFEVIACILDDHSVAESAQPAPHVKYDRAIVQQVHCETKLRNLGLNLPLPEAIARLQGALFSHTDIQRILNLPYGGWHRSWWIMADQDGEFTLPFQRSLRSRRFADGSVSLQYKDLFAHLPPLHFRSYAETALLHIQRPGDSFAQLLGQINQARQCLQVHHAILIYHQLSILEQQAFTRQGIQLYNAIPDTTLSAMESPAPPASPTLGTAPTRPSPTQTGHTTNCGQCVQGQCPLHGNADSPVVDCQLFQPDDFGK